MAQEPPAQLGALAPANIAKNRPKPPFDLTGTWQHGGGQNNSFRFSPPEGFKLTPSAQQHYDAAKKAAAAGKVYVDDIGACWPAGLPVIMTRVWPIAMIQLPTVIYMISGFVNSIRIIYLDGRKHTDPDVVVRSFSGESIGHWEGDTLVVDTRNFVDDHHWLDSGIPLTDEFRMIERIRLIDKGRIWKSNIRPPTPRAGKASGSGPSVSGGWTTTDITEASCLPDLNEHMPSMKGHI